MFRLACKPGNNFRGASGRVMCLVSLNLKSSVRFRLAQFSFIAKHPYGCCRWRSDQVWRLFKGYVFKTLFVHKDILQSYRIRHLLLTIKKSIMDTHNSKQTLALSIFSIIIMLS